MPNDKKMTLRIFISFLGILVAASITGCGQQAEDLPTVVPVSGQVLYNGNPVGGAVVSFRGDGSQKPAVGKTDSEGNFQLTTFGDNDGAIPGKHLVTVSKIASQGEAKKMSMEEAAKTENAEVPEAKNELPERYADPQQSGLEFTVEEGSENNFTIELEG